MTDPDENSSVRSVPFVGDINGESDLDSLSTKRSNNNGQSTNSVPNVDTTNKNTNHKSGTDDDLNDPLQWHEFLCEAETARRLNITSKLQHNILYRESLQQLLDSSIAETETAYRLTIGLALAQEQLSKTLLIGMNSTTSTLHGGPAGKMKSTDTKSIKRGGDKQNTISSSTAADDNTNPPVMSITVPEDDAVTVLEEQHSHLHHKVSRTVPHQQHAAKRIKELADRSAKYSNKLNDRAKQILDELQETEDDVQRAWGKSLFFCKLKKKIKRDDSNDEDATKSNHISNIYAVFVHRTTIFIV
jgi:hypothetical protein